jgi:hypothetical protein
MLAKRNSYKFNTEFLQGLPVDEVAGGWCVKSQPSIRVPFRGQRFYRHGWQSWSFSGWLSAGHTFPTPPSHPMAIRMNEDLPYASRLDRVSAGVAMLEDEHGNALLLGAADPGGRVFHEENALRGACEEGSGTGSSLPARRIPSWRLMRASCKPVMAPLDMLKRRASGAPGILYITSSPSPSSCRSWRHSAICRLMSSR